MGSVYVLIDSEYVVYYFKNIFFKNTNNLIIQNVKTDTTIKIVYGCANKCLNIKVVAVINSDNAFGNGWEQFNYSILYLPDIHQN